MRWHRQGPILEIRLLLDYVASPSHFKQLETILYTDLLQFIFSGLTGGAIYALIALGFCVVSNTMGIVNFIQVDFVTLGGMFMFSALFALGLPTIPSLGLAVILVALTAMVIERVGLRPARSDNHLVLIFLTVGLSIIVRGVIKIVWGTNRMALPPLTPDVPVQILGASVLPQACGFWA